MNHPSPQSLLRRTAAAVAATAGLLLAMPASALNMALPGGQTCTMSTNNAITVAPDGSLVLTCSSLSGVPPPPPPPATPTVYITAPTQFPLNTSITPWVPTNVYMTATVAPTADLTVAYNIGGSGCYANGQNPPATGTTVIPANATQSAGIGIMATAAGSICSIGIISLTPSTTFTTTGQTGGTMPSHVDVPVAMTVGAPPPPPPPPPGGTIPAGPSTCASPAPGTTMATLPSPFVNGAPITQLASSGQVLSFPLQNLSAINKQNGQIALGESPIAGTPSPYTLTASISPCPGVITQTPGNLCDYFASATNGSTFQWANSQTAANNNGVCYQPDSPQLYFNVQWTYSKCSNGAATCGWTVNTTGW